MCLDSGVIPATPARSVIFFQFTLSRSNAYNLIVTHAGLAVQLSGTIDSPVQRNGRQYVYYTDLNGVVSGTNECWSTIDRLFMNETLHGSQSIQGVVYRRNQPLAGARVTCVTHEDDSFCGRATTDSDGKYRFSNLRSGVQYDLLASYTMGSGAYSAYPLPGVVPRFIPDP